MSRLPKGSLDDCFAFAGPTLGVDEARARLATGVGSITGIESVALDQSVGRVLAEPLVSPLDVPGFDNAAVDGYAMAAVSLAPQGKTRLALRVGRAAAGHPFPAPIAAGEAVKVLTGAPMPDGTDTVAMWEQVVVEGQGLIVPFPLPAGHNRRRQGEDMQRGQTIVAAGQILAPQHLGVAARLGMTALPVHERLRVAVASSGDEITEPGQPLTPGGVYDANRVMLKALLRALPVTVTDLGILPDDPDIVRTRLLAAAREHDLLLTSGGASHGDEDHLVQMVKAQGVLHFWEVRMKPGRPLAMGRLENTSFIGLPGNPVASMVCFLIFARPVILALAGARWPDLPLRQLPAAFRLERHRTGRTEILRARIESSGGRAAAHLIGRQGSHILTSLTEADGVVVIPEERQLVEEGQPVLYASFADLGVPL